MTSWKNFKNWLEREVVTHDGLKVKIRLEKRVLYGELSETVLTNFMDSLEATLDKNNSYHLFPDFDEYQDFEVLFNERVAFGKKTNQKEVKSSDRKLLEKLFREWRGEEEKTWEWKKFHNELALIICPEIPFAFNGYISNDLILEKVRELAKKIPELEGKLKELNLKLKNNRTRSDEEATQNLYEEKNNEILQLKRRLELLEESRSEMVSDREGKIEELENQLENKQVEINWLHGQLKKVLGKGQYQAQIEVNYPARFKN